jgi:protein-disulfide isomerase
MAAKKENKSITIPIPSLSMIPSKLKTTQVLVALLIIASFFLGSLWTKVQYLEKNNTSGSNTAGVAGVTSAPQAPVGDTGTVTVSVDDDPVLGDKNAKVTLIDFSDYECPFCKRHFEQTLPELIKKYIDTGKVKMVYRDLPLPFHDPMATTEAIAANCARDQGDDSTYYKYHDEIFKRTTSNGNGLTKENLYTIASDLGLNADTFKSCLDSEKYKEEVQKDLADATKAGATGTPTFFIGKSSRNGQISATKLVGAQPFAQFEALIDKALQ